MGVELKVKVTTNADEVLAALAEKIASITKVAVPRALNRLLDQAQVAGVRVATEKFDVTRANMFKYGRFKYSRANSGDPSAELLITGASFPLWIFPHRQTRTGVQVTLHKKPFLFPHAFQIKSRGRKVYARGSYSATGSTEAFDGREGALFVPTGEAFWRFKFGRHRFPLSIVRTMSPPGVFAHEDINEAMLARVEEQAAKVMAQEIRYARSQA